ncbi:MAG TPA: hypothetical protein VMB79_18890 [Jatrophihabitans sp.]|nr:hypothetical protein [Jatrophihabitans sp.]
MSIATEARGYADLAVAQGRSAFAQATAALQQRRTTLTNANRKLVADAPKPAYAALGAADLVAATVTKRIEDLPVDAVQGVSKAQQAGQSLVERAQSEAQGRLAELRTRLESGRETVSALPAAARSAGETYLESAKATGEAYLTVAKGVFDSLSDRGEERAAELREDPRLVKLRKDPRVARLFGQLGLVAESVQDVPPAAKSAFDAVADSATTEAAPAKPRKAPARKATARKSAAKSAASKSAGGKA